MQCAAQHENSRDHDGRLAAESGKRLFRIQDTRDIKRKHDHDRDQVGAYPFRDKEQQGSSQDEKKDDLLRTETSEHKFFPGAQPAEDNCGQLLFDSVLVEGVTGTEYMERWLLQSRASKRCLEYRL